MIHFQFLKYAIVGLGTNAVLFLVYLWLTGKGLGHLLAMSLVYCLGVALGFVFNRAWTFAHQGTWSAAFLRYALAYVLGYFFNLGLLFLLVDVMGLAHQPVQGLLILVTAVFLFLLQKFWVFEDRAQT